MGDSVCKLRLVNELKMDSAYRNNSDASIRTVRRPTSTITRHFLFEISSSKDRCPCIVGNQQLKFAKAPLTVSLVRTLSLEVACAVMSMTMTG